MTMSSERAQELVAELHSAAAELTTSDAWRHMLDVTRSQHAYSFRNRMLIALAGGSVVAGYKAWGERGRQVRKGEHGIAILAPCTRVYEKDDGSKGYRLTGFRVTTVFDISQTDGPELPADPKLLEGSAPAGMLESTIAAISSEGYAFSRGDAYGANGFTDSAAHTVVVRDDVDDAQAVKTAVHELAHILLHCGEGFDYRACRGEAEVVAESVAYVVAGMLDLPTGEYSFPYVAGWAGGDAERILKTGDLVIKTAERIAGMLEATSLAVAS